jgi:hypothetical protein
MTVKKKCRGVGIEPATWFNSDSARPLDYAAFDVNNVFLFYKQNCLFAPLLAMYR